MVAVRHFMQFPIADRDHLSAPIAASHGQLAHPKHMHKFGDFFLRGLKKN